METVNCALVDALIGANVHGPVPDTRAPIQVNRVRHPVPVCAPVDARGIIQQTIIFGVRAF